MIFNIRLRQSNDDLTADEIEDLESAEAERLNDDARDRELEDLYQEKP